MATKKFLTPRQINDLTDEIRSRGFQSRTDTYIIQQSFARLVVNRGLVNEGYVRTMTEANKFLTKIYGDNAILYTEETYQQDLQSLNDALTGYKSVRQYLYKNRQRLVDIVRSAENWLGYDETDLSHISTTKLHMLVRQANQMAQSDSGGSPTFYQHLMELLEEQ